MNKIEHKKRSYKQNLSVGLLLHPPKSDDTYAQLTLLFSNILTLKNIMECIFLSQGRHYDSFPDFTPSSDASWCLTHL